MLARSTQAWRVNPLATTSSPRVSSYVKVKDAGNWLAEIRMVSEQPAYVRRVVAVQRVVNGVFR